MTDLSISTIEQVITDGQVLSAELSKVMTEISKEKVGDYKNRIARFLNKIDSMNKDLARVIREHRNWQGALSILENTLKQDNREANDRYWKIHNGEVEIDKGGDVVDSEF